MAFKNTYGRNSADYWQQRFEQAEAANKSLRTQLAEAEARVEKARNEGLEEAINYATRRQAGWEAECRGVPGHRLEAMHKANAAGAIIGDIRSLITNNLESSDDEDGNVWKRIVPTPTTKED